MMPPNCTGHTPVRSRISASTRDVVRHSPSCQTCNRTAVLTWQTNRTDVTPVTSASRTSRAWENTSPNTRRRSIWRRTYVTCVVSPTRRKTYLTRHMAKHSFDGRNPPPKPSHTASQTPMSPPHQHPPESPIDLKPLDPHSPSVSAISHIGASSDSSKPSSAFMPLAHQYPSPNMINSPVPSNFPFPPPRIPVSTTLSSQLPHLSSVSSSRYFPFDSVPQFPPKREVERGPMGMGVGRDGMIATQMLSLQQIKNFSSTHPMFSKSEPSSPVHKDGFSWLNCYSM